MKKLELVEQAVRVIVGLVDDESPPLRNLVYNSIRRGRDGLLPFADGVVKSSALVRELGDSTVLADREPSVCVATGGPSHPHRDQYGSLHEMQVTRVNFLGEFFDQSEGTLTIARPVGCDPNNPDVLNELLNEGAFEPRADVLAHVLGEGKDSHVEDLGLKKKLLACFLLSTSTG